MRPSLALPLSALSPRSSSGSERCSAGAGGAGSAGAPSSRASGPASCLSPGTGRWEDTASVLIAHYGASATCVLPWLYVSGHLPAASAPLLAALNIGLVVNTAGEVVANAFEGGGGGGADATPAPAPAYLTLALRDGPSEDVWCLFAPVCRAIERARASGAAALLCCHMGISRSASFAIAYLMWAGGLPQRTAYTYVRALRPVVSPNPGFTCQLLEWQAHLALLRGSGGGGGGAPPPPPLLYRLRRLMEGCAASGALLAAARRRQLARALTLQRCAETRALVAPGAPGALAGALAALPPSEALLRCEFSSGAAGGEGEGGGGCGGLLLGRCQLLLAQGEGGAGAPEVPEAAALREAALEELASWSALCGAGAGELQGRVLGAVAEACALGAGAGAGAGAGEGEGEGASAGLGAAEGVLLQCQAEARAGFAAVAGELQQLQLQGSAGAWRRVAWELVEA